MILHPFAHDTFISWKTFAGVFALLVLISSSASGAGASGRYRFKNQLRCSWRRENNPGASTTWLRNKQAPLSSALHDRW